MGTHDKRIDAYIARSAEFARPILEEVRVLIHDACPEVEETIKWGFPHFMYHGILCSMAAFKAHCALHFWKCRRLEAHGLQSREGAMGQFGRITSRKDLPGKVAFKRLVKVAMALRREDATAQRAALPVPADLQAALAKHRKARTTFEAFSPGQRREYVEWITEARRPETRAKRLALTLEWLGEGKKFGWKYEKC